ncbi:hypothetical protein ACSQ67_004144 [Phaseolus vulgaris]
MGYKKRLIPYFMCLYAIFWTLLVLHLLLKVSGNAEGDALTTFKNNMIDPTDALRSWEPGVITPCTWLHVTCNAESSVIRLDLGNANLSGQLVPELGQLPNLEYLRLSKNSLSGKIPVGLTTIDTLQVLDLSYNNLTGNVPIDGSFSSFTPISFDHNPFLKQTTPTSPRVIQKQNPSGNSYISIAAIAGGVAVGAALLFAAPVIAFVYWKRRKPPDYFFDVAADEDPEVNFGQLKRFSLHELLVATDAFNNKNIIGRGGFGKVYKGRLTNGDLVAVKRLNQERIHCEEKQFQIEVEIISMAVHRNLLRLIGFCMTTTERLLVFPFMVNGSVESCLRERAESQAPVQWPVRKRIALGAAKGLAYLHDHCNPKIIHRDIKAANVLLDKDFEAVVGDFGLAKIMDYKNTHVTTAVRGTLGHIAPEYLSTGKSSEKTDVFGYGVMLLEIITGQRAFNLARHAISDEVMLLEWVKSLLKERKLKTLVDADLHGDYDEEELEELIQIALLCTQSSPLDRPKMSEVVRMLEGEVLVLDFMVKVSGNQEGDALDAFKGNMNDPNNVLQSWDSTLVNPCTWFHVTCDNDNRVIRVDLGNANLSGELVAQLGQLPKLQYLRLNNNTLSGKIPMRLTNVDKLQVLDLSNNNLTGDVPTTGSFSYFTPISFRNNPLLNYSSIQSPPASAPPQSPPAEGEAWSVEGNNNRAVGIIAGGVAVGAALLFAAPVIALVYCKRRKPQDFFFDVAAEEDPEVHLGQLKRFSLRELQVATDTFNNKNVLGRGGFGKVYKGRLTNGYLVAVKRLKEERTQGGEMQFQTEVEMISMAVHRNLLRLHGFCMTPTERLLVYPFMANGSVASCLRARLANDDDVMLLDWVKALLKDKRLETLVDGDLEGSYEEEEAEELIQVALLCTQSSPLERPKMSEVVRMLEGEGLAEKWEKWWQKEDTIQQKFDPSSLHHAYWPLSDSTSNILPDELSGPR